MFIKLTVTAMVSTLFYGRLIECRYGVYRADVGVLPRMHDKQSEERRVATTGTFDVIVGFIQSRPQITFCRPSIEVSHSHFAFPAPKGGMLSDMTLTAVLRRMQVDAVPHGFRSTFRDWCAEQTEYPNEVAEMALAHAVGNKVEAAYRRGDLPEKRVQLMRDWAIHVGAAIEP